MKGELGLLKPDFLIRPPWVSRGTLSYPVPWNTFRIFAPDIPYVWISCLRSNCRRTGKCWIVRVHFLGRLITPTGDRPSAQEAASVPHPSVSTWVALILAERQIRGFWWILEQSLFIYTGSSVMACASQGQDCRHICVSGGKNRKTRQDGNWVLKKQDFR